MEAAMAEKQARETDSRNPFPEFGDPVRVLPPGADHARYGLALVHISLESLEGTGPESLRGADAMCGLCGFRSEDQFREARNAKGLPVWTVPAGVSGFGRIKVVGFLSQFVGDNGWLAVHNPARLAEIGIRPSRGGVRGE
jgi:hypothetical protein